MQNEWVINNLVQKQLAAQLSNGGSTGFVFLSSIQASFWLTLVGQLNVSTGDVVGEFST